MVFHSVERGNSLCPELVFTTCREKWWKRKWGLEKMHIRKGFWVWGWAIRPKHATETLFFSQKTSQSNSGFPSRVFVWWKGFQACLLVLRTFTEGRDLAVFQQPCQAKSWICLSLHELGKKWKLSFLKGTVHPKIRFIYFSSYLLFINLDSFGVSCLVLEIFPPSL